MYCSRAIFGVALISIGFAFSAHGAAYKAVDLFTYQASGDLNSLQPDYYQAVAGGQAVGYATGPSLNGGQHAVAWSGPTGAAVDLNPQGFDVSAANGTDGIYQVGYASTFGGNAHAILWNGTAGSFVDLGSSPLGGSMAYGVAGGQQVGTGGGHALLWSGSAASVSDLGIGTAYGVGGGQQVGNGSFVNTPKAYVWSGSAASAVNLQPGTFTYSLAVGTDGTQQVGFGFNAIAGGSPHALVWSGTADSVMDLNPDGYTNSEALGVANGFQVGYGTFGGSSQHALAWFGSAQAFTDLNALLPSGLTQSSATTIDSNGNIFGYAYGSANTYHAVEWTPVPEPSSLVLLGAAGALCVSWRGSRAFGGKRTEKV